MSRLSALVGTLTFVQPRLKQRKSRCLAIVEQYRSLTQPISLGHIAISAGSCIDRSKYCKRRQKQLSFCVKRCLGLYGHK